MMAASVDFRSVNQCSAEICHSMPCAIEHNGKANVTQFFTTTVASSRTGSKQMENEYTGSFRGRPLNGQELKVPEGYTGLVLHEPHQRSVEDEKRRLVVSNTFNKFMFWNLDRQPTEDDPVQKALQWIDISEAIHKPVPNIPSLSSQGSSIKGN